MNTPPKNVLTAKKGLFWGVLEEKRGGSREKKAFYFAFLRVFGDGLLGKPLSIRNLHRTEPSKKNRA
jgi:hypothetical protein